MALTPVTEFCRLELANTSNIWADLVDNGYDDLGEHYTPAGEGDEVVNSIDLDYIAMADVVATRCRGGMVSAYETQVVVFVDKQGGVWFNAADFDEYF